MFADMLKVPVADQFKLRRIKGDVGLELEMEGDNLFAGALTTTFTGKPDGSLRGGMEYISKPLSRELVAAKVDELTQALTKIKAVIRPSYRCSTHIHENYLDATFGDVLGTYICWALVEPAAFRAIPEGRDGSLFCVSGYDSGDLPAYFERFCQQLETGFEHGFNPRGKYSSLNMTRLGHGEHNALGTLEYRIFPLSVDGQQVQQWANWCGNIKSFVQKWGAIDPSFVEMVRWVEANPHDFLSAILGKHGLQKEEVPLLVDFGVRQAYELARITAAALSAKPKPQLQKKKPTFAVGLDGEMLHIPRVGAIHEEVVPAQPVVGFQRRRRAAVGGGANAAAGNGAARVLPRARRQP